MRRLDEKLIKNGFRYTLVLRGSRSCIYRQEVTPNTSYFEVFLIKFRSEKEILGKLIPEREVFPANEDFGEWAWSCRTLEKAMKKYYKLESKKT